MCRNAGGRNLVRLAGGHAPDLLSEREHGFTFNHEPALFGGMAVRLWHGARGDADECHAGGAAAVDVCPVRPHPAIVVEAIDHDEVRARDVVAGKRLGPDVEGQRPLPGVAERERRVRRQREADALPHLVRFRVHRNRAGACHREKHLTLTGSRPAIGTCARRNRRLADGGDVHEHCSLFRGMKRVGSFEPGQNVPKDNAAVHGARRGVLPVIDEHVDVRIDTRIDRRRVKRIFSRCSRLCLLRVCRAWRPRRRPQVKA